MCIVDVATTLQNHIFLIGANCQNNVKETATFSKISFNKTKIWDVFVIGKYLRGSASTCPVGGLTTSEMYMIVGKIQCVHLL
jgi:hypothetical protein